MNKYRFGFDFQPDPVGGGGSSGGSGDSQTATNDYINQVTDKNNVTHDIYDIDHDKFLRLSSLIFGSSINSWTDNPQVTKLTTGDCNSLTNGFYWVDSNVVANYPFSSGYLIATNNYIQIAFANGNNQGSSPVMAIRFKTSNSDGAWHIVGENDYNILFNDNGGVNTAYRIRSTNSTQTSNPDLNSYKTAGTYYGQGTYLPQNFPVGDRTRFKSSKVNYVLIVAKETTNVVRQHLACTFGTDNAGYTMAQFNRISKDSGTTWTPWTAENPGLYASLVTDLDTLYQPGQYIARAAATGAPSDLANAKYTVEVLLDYADGWYPRVMQIARYQYSVYIRYSNTITTSTVTWNSWKKLTAT